MTSISQWLSGTEAMQLRDCEFRLLAELLREARGEKVLLMGPLAGQSQCLAAMPPDHAWVLDDSDPQQGAWAGQPGADWPLADDSMDLVVLRHCLATETLCRHRLNQAARVLKGQGLLLLLGLNPRGWLGWRAGQRSLPAAPTLAQMLGSLPFRQVRHVGQGLGPWMNGRLDGPLAGFGNLQLRLLQRERLNGNVRRVRFNQARARGRGVPASQGLMREQKAG